MSETSDSPPTSLPASRHPGSAGRRLSTEQVEAVVRRAVELQTDEADPADAGVSDEELVRIGGELGISPGHMRRALAELSAEPVETGGGFLGPAKLSASRAVPGEPDAVRRHIEEYLVDTQYLAVVRRLADRTKYVKSGGLQVEMARAMEATRAVVSGQRPNRIGPGFDLRTARSVEVRVAQADEDHSYVTLTADLGNQRVGHWVGINSGIGAGAITAGIISSVVIAPVAAVVAVPIMGVSVWVARTTYGALAEKARVHLEAMLDHLERGESLLGG